MNKQSLIETLQRVIPQFHTVLLPDGRLSINNIQFDIIETDLILEQTQNSINAITQIIIDISTKGNKLPQDIIDENVYLERLQKIRESNPIDEQPSRTPLIKDDNADDYI